MPKVTREDLEPGTGLASNFNGSISYVRFGVKESYAAKVEGTAEPMLLATIVSPELGEPIEQAYSMGTSWAEARGGMEVTNIKNPDSHRFNAGSRAGTLVDRIFKAIGGGDKVKGQEYLLKRDRWMTEAEFYAGLNFHWILEKLPTVGGETKDVLLPDKFLGEVTASATPTSKPTSSTTEFDFGTEAIADLVGLASGKTDRELKMALIKDEKLRGNADIKNQVFNKGLLTALEKEGLLVKGEDGKYR